MFNSSLIWFLIISALCVLGGLVLRLVKSKPSQASKPGGLDDQEKAISLFSLQLPELQESFFKLASVTGKPRDLIWTQIEWQAQQAFAFDQQHQLFTAFVGIEIYFEAVPDGEMEGIEAVSQIRHGSAVFHYRDQSWGTGGKTLFNLEPHEVVSRLAHQFTAQIQS